jgi:hypothetical protein
LKFIFKHLSQNSEKPAGDDRGAAPVYIVVGLVVVVCVDLVSWFQVLSIACALLLEVIFLNMFVVLLWWET